MCCQCSVRHRYYCDWRCALVMARRSDDRTHQQMSIGTRSSHRRGACRRFCQILSATSAPVAPQSSGSGLPDETRRRSRRSDTSRTDALVIISLTAAIHNPLRRGDSKTPLMAPLCFLHTNISDADSSERLRCRLALRMLVLAQKADAVQSLCTVSQCAQQRGYETTHQLNSCKADCWYRRRHRETVRWSANALCRLVKNG